MKFTILIAFASFILCACTSKIPTYESKKIAYYYVTSTQKHKTDTSKYEELNRLDSTDRLIANGMLDCCGFHLIKVYSSEGFGGVDSGELKYTLDSIGVIYIRPIYWPGFVRLRSNNDSINDLIDCAYGKMLTMRLNRGPDKME